MRLNIRLDPSRNGGEAAALATGLRAKIVGQEDAIQRIVEVYQTYLAGLNSPRRPAGSFLFLGPTGTGKTRTVEALAETLVGDACAVVKIDCGEFQHSHEIAKLIGSPPGYLGHRETHPLLGQDAIDAHQTENVKLSFVLFDEIEKASDALWNLLLGILDKANLTLGDNRTVDFSRAMIFMTSNLGANAIASLLSPKMGFATAAQESGLNGKIERAGTDAVRRRFTPEFVNRIDKTVVFHPLSGDDLDRIFDLELDALKARIRESQQTAPFAVTVTSAARRFLLAEGSDMRYGARHLKRAIDRELVHPLANLVASGQVAGGDWVQVDYESEPHGVVFLKQAENLPLAELSGIECAGPEPPPERAATAAKAGRARSAPARH